MNPRQRLFRVAWPVRAMSISLSVGLPVLLLHEPDPATPPRGIPFLALPAGLGVAPDPLAGWERFPSAPEDPACGPVASGQEPTRETEKAALPERILAIELFGHVNEGSREVFCFHDRESNRWFRLSAGETDPETMVTLLGGSGGGPVLLDLLTGHGYRIDPLGHQLIQQSEPSPPTEP